MVSIMVILTLIPMVLSALYMIANQLGLTKKAEDMVLEVEAASVMDRKLCQRPLSCGYESCNMT